MGVGVRTFLHGGKRARLCGIVGGFLLHMNDDFYVYNDSLMIITIYDWGGTKTDTSIQSNLLQRTKSRKITQLTFNLLAV